MIKSETLGSGCKLVGLRSSQDQISANCSLLCCVLLPVWSTGQRERSGEAQGGRVRSRTGNWLNKQGGKGKGNRIDKAWEKMPREREKEGKMFKGCGISEFIYCFPEKTDRYTDLHRLTDREADFLLQVLP